MNILLYLNNLLSNPFQQELRYISTHLKLQGNDSDKIVLILAPQKMRWSIILKTSSCIIHKEIVIKNLFKKNLHEPYARRGASRTIDNAQNFRNTYHEHCPIQGCFI